MCERERDGKRERERECVLEIENERQYACMTVS